MTKLEKLKAERDQRITALKSEREALTAAKVRVEEKLKDAEAELHRRQRLYSERLQNGDEAIAALDSQIRQAEADIFADELLTVADALDHGSPMN